MKRYGNEMKRMLIAVIIIAAIIATGILLASYNIENPDDPGPPSHDHTGDLPIAPLAIIIQSGTYGTRVIADIEFGFTEHEYDYLVGYRRDFLDVRNGLNRSNVVGLGYTELRFYAFAYLGDVRLFDDREEGGPQQGISDQLSWTPHIAEGEHTGPIWKDNLTQLTNAGVILEIIDFKIYFEDGTNFFCGPANLTVGVNFTRNGDEWIIDYIYDASDNDSVYFLPALVSIQLSSPIPEKPEVTTTEHTTDVVEVSIVLLTAPTIIAVVLIAIILVMTRRRR